MEKRWFVQTDDEFNSPLWWGEINLRASKGDPFARKLSENDRILGSKKTILEIVAYAQSIAGYYDGDERAPEAVIFGPEIDEE
jgi:hypothetical protein